MADQPDTPGDNGVHWPAAAQIWQKKHLSFAYAWWFVLGAIGLHRFYIGSYFWAVLMLGAIMLSGALMFQMAVTGAEPSAALMVVVNILMWGTILRWIADGILLPQILWKINDPAGYTTARRNAKWWVGHPPQPRSAYMAYWLLLFMGWFGAHRIYAGAYRSGFVLMCLAVITQTLPVERVHFSIPYWPFIWVVVDIIFVPNLIRHYNRCKGFGPNIIW